MELELLSILAGGGPVAILAGIIFFMYRNDSKGHADQWRDANEELVQVRKDEVRSRDDNSRALTELSVAIKLLSNGRRKK